MSKSFPQTPTVAVVGATGAVGREMLAILQERDFPLGKLRLMASSRSAGARVNFGGREVEIEDLAQADFAGVDIVLSSAGGAVSKAFAPRAVQAGAVVIDNTSAFRMDPQVPLVVPEVNPEAIATHQGIIANPNCSTIQLACVLWPLHQAAGLERVVVSTYQSASGAGQKGVDELLCGVRAYIDGEQEAKPATFAHPLAFEALPQIDVFMDDGFTREEEKMMRETRKIMGLDELEIAATCVRVPVVRGHGESVTVDLKGALPVAQARALWEQAPGIEVYDEPAQAKYPLARSSAGTDPCWVGRLRQDRDRLQTLHFWVVADNLRKGAALNAVQIAEALLT
ncbi:aspartate-semialdehyde dehydrogenase [Lujinxingia litoralis]|uniref:Aspartate-semialdehyde dehydrogenase n=1 Tax=Lujinxingia litoralis TaxID=2211119 RepID=A0A328C777_9DELT|nr:aspartate-semialdehyde dehydrogenase [Lujinxingia litoralis]RAL22250.1 aspartate-semialdehyde dehydrogenase [Lujinxingia litoralis]